MSDSTAYEGSGQAPRPVDAEAPHPKHRLEGVDVDAPSADELLGDFGQNPDTETTG